MRKAFLVACLFAAVGASPVLAANATHPYANCDKKVDNCGPTGDNQTDQLNSQQLGGSPSTSGTAMPTDTTAPQPGQPLSR